MERLTHYETPEKHAYVDRGLVSLGWYSMADEGFRGPAIDRLAAYEDAMTLERAQELAKAEQAGHLKVFPCKVGDVVYLLHPRGDGIRSAKVDRIEMTKTRMERDLVICLDLGDGRQETFRWASDKGRT